MLEIVPLMIPRRMRVVCSISIIFWIFFLVKPIVCRMAISDLLSWMFWLTTIAIPKVARRSARVPRRRKMSRYVF